MIKSRRMIGRECSMHWGKGNECRILVGESEGKKLLGRPRRMWKDDNKIDLREIGWGDTDGINLAERDQWRALVNMAMNLRFP
jgi:hypothetical protein